MKKPTITPASSAFRGYKPGGKKRTNLSLNAELAALAKQWFPDGLTDFVERKLRSEFRRLAPRIRRAGHKLPESLFTK